MMGRANLSLVLTIWLIVLAVPKESKAERWSRQVSNSEWIPLANPRSQQGHHQNVAPPSLPQIHQPLIPGTLPPELRQEYQQQLMQLQKTQESIQRLLVLQQQLKQQQQLLQGQAYLPNGLAGSQENKESLHQSAIANVQTLPELAPEVLVPQQLSGEARPPVYTSQNFREPQGALGQEQYEDYVERHPEDYRNSERPRESQRDREKYVSEAPSGSETAAEIGEDGEEEVQVVYVPAETLAQRGHSGNQQRGRDRKQYGHQDSRIQRPYSNQRGQESQEPHERNNAPTTVSPEDDAYAREFLQQLQREHEGTDRLLKEARQKELDRLREERKEIQRQAKLQQAALEREQEIQRQREAEKKRKELAKLEETAKQRELERIRASRERQRLEDIERSKKAQARANEEKRKQEEARQIEIDRLAVLEREKKAEIEKTIAAQKELERVQKEDEQRAKERDRTLTRQKESSRTSETSPQAEQLIRSQHNHQQHGHSGKYNRHSRVRTKPRQRQQTLNSQNIDHFGHSTQETTTTAPSLSPNQPPLAVYMSNLGSDTRVIRISDVLKNLKNAKTIDVLDTVGQDVPQVFVGPSNLEVPSGYAKFDLPYLSSIDNNRVERRVDKLPFFVAPLSFNPPPGYSKIPFPAPHIGSVVVNTLDNHIHPSQPDGSPDEVGKQDLNPLIEPNAFIEDSNQGVSYSTTYDSPTTPTYANYRQDEPSSTPKYQSSPSYSAIDISGPGRTYRFRQHFAGERPSSPGSQDQSQSRPAIHEQSQLRPASQEESPVVPNRSPQYDDGSSGSTTPIYRRPTVETSFSYQEPTHAVSSTPVYQESYSQVHEGSPNRPTQVTSGNRDPPQHREVVHRYQLQGQQVNEHGEEYPTGQVDSGVINSYDESLRGPTQYNLPAELPPIIPQLPGLVNSLLDENEQATHINRQPTTSTTTTTTTTTTPAPTTTARSRGRHRGRVVATRPSTTTTTTLSPPSKSRDTERTRRPFGRSRTRFTTTTEEYRDAYEPTKSRVADTTQRSYSHQDSYKRPTSAKTQKFKHRETEESVHSSRNQVHNVQAHEAVSNERNPSLDSNSQLPDAPEVNPNEPMYTQYNFAPSTVGVDNYPSQSGDDRRTDHSATGVDYSKTLNYPQARPPAQENSRLHEEQVSQEYSEKFPTTDYSHTNLEDSPVNGFNYQVKSIPTIPPTSRDFTYYQKQPENFENSQGSAIATETPVNSQINDYQRPSFYENSRDVGQNANDDLSRPQTHYSSNEQKNIGFESNDGAVYDHFSKDNQEGFRAIDRLPEQAPLEVTTEAATTTSSTTEAPVIIRQRVRGRLGGRGRPDSTIQTRARGPQDEYVRFSAVNNQHPSTTERPTNRHRESTRSRPKTRPQYNPVQVQTEGNDYVRIQAPIRTYQKTIVTPPSTTQRTTTTTLAPTTTTVEYESNDEIEYGFIRPPNFNPVHPVENKYQNSFRPADNQIRLQSVLPSDETAEDSSPSHAQIPRNRSKYQSPNRRPTSKATLSTTPTYDPAPYTEKPRTRLDEPKNNRIRVRGRKPGRRRTTSTTTTTTTEYVLEDTNDLPLEENYPRPIESVHDPGRQTYYEEKYESLPLPSGVTGNPVQQQQHDESSFSGQDFLLNFGSEPGNPEADQAQLASQPLQKYSQASGSRLRTNAPRRGSQDGDIYGAESQWSTKLTSTSFQPSLTANRLPHEQVKDSNTSENERYKYANDEASADEPEIITAAPEESYVTVLVSSDDRGSKSASSSADVAIEAASMEGTNFGMKTNTFMRSTTPTSTSQDTLSSSSGISNFSESTATSEAENSNETKPQTQPTRRMGGRRRRVRVRVRPAPVDDFVTAESQHFNSAVNSLVHGRLKYNRFGEEPRETTTTTRAAVQQEFLTTAVDEKTMLDDFLDEVFKKVNKSSAETVSPIVDNSEQVITTTRASISSENTENLETTTAGTTNFETTTIGTTNFETTVNNLDEDSKTSNELDWTETSTDPPLMTTMTIPRKSWDSTKQYIDSIAMNSGEYISNPKYHQENADRNENLTGQRNEVFQNDYRDNGIKSEENTVKEENEGGNYPKNHRSEWSEVRYPSDRGLYNYDRRARVNLTAAHLPGVVTKSDGDTSVKTLSDYVKAIFDTMKNADEEKAVDDTVFEVNSSGEENVSSSTGASSTDLSLENVSTTIFPEPTNYPTATEVETFSSTTEKAEVVSANESEDKKEIDEKLENRTEFPSGIADDETQRTQYTESVEPTRDIEGSMDVTTTEVNPTSSDSLVASDASVSFSSTITASETSSSLETTEAATTTEIAPISKNSSETKLGAILRTSTTTKVSHMTEICFRGRCVMTKPTKEIGER